MKHADILKAISEMPDFYAEDWLEQAYEKFDQSKMTAEQRANFMIAISKRQYIINGLKEEEMQRQAEQKRDIEQSRKEGRAEGKAQSTTALAKKMKAKGISISDIAEITGLSLEVIEAL